MAVLPCVRDSCIFHKKNRAGLACGKELHMEKDLVDYNYLSDDLRYADLFNGALFGGKQIVDAANLGERDTKVVVSGRKKKARTRDVIRKYGKETNYAVMGVENQEEVSYCMPFRVLEYETAEYGRQVAKVKQRNREDRNLSDGEFLERYRKTDKLHPCMTLVLYWGENWDGPETLKEMMNMEALPEHMKQFVNDYPMHLVNVKEFGDTSVFKTDLKQVFDFIKCSGSKEEIKRLVMNNPAYENLDMDAYDVMTVHAHSKELEELRDRVEKEEGDMCKGLADWAKEERELGMEQGIEQGILLYAYRMVERGRLSVKEALEDLKSSQDEADFVAAMQAAGFKLP